MGFPAHMSYPIPAADEVVILHSAIALDCPKSLAQKTIHPQHATPSQSVIGTVVQIGDNVTRFSSGQRVMAYREMCKAGSVPHAGLQRYSTIPQALVSAIPDSLELREVSTLPLSVTLAAVGLYQRNHLNLHLPRTPSEHEEEEHTKRTILIIDGASEIGALAIQLATASGARVVATATSNPDATFVQSLGANLVVVDDQEDPSVARAALAAAALGAGGAEQLSGIFDTRSTDQSFAQVDALLQDLLQNPRVCAVKPPAYPPRSFVPTVAISSTINRSAYMHIRSAIWGEFLPEALASGRLRIVRSARQTAIPGVVSTSGALDVKDVLERQRADSAVVMSCE